jgi:hypothetical protein
MCPHGALSWSASTPVLNPSLVNAGVGDMFLKVTGAAHACPASAPPVS